MSADRDPEKDKRAGTKSGKTKEDRVKRTKTEKNRKGNNTRTKQYQHKVAKEQK